MTSQGGVSVASSAASQLSERQWQRFATSGHTKEISRTIHVGTPAFLAPEILLKLVKSKGVDLDKEKRKQQKRQRKRLQHKMQRRRDREQRRLEEEEEEQREQEHKVSEVSSSEESEAERLSANHYVRGALQEHNLDPHIYCDFATDVYSFGMVLWSVVTRKLPYKGFKPMDMILMIKNAQRLNVSEHEWRKWERCKGLEIDVDKLRDLLEQCWAQYPYQRPSFDVISITLAAIIADAHCKHGSTPRIKIDPSSIVTAATETT